MPKSLVEQGTFGILGLGSRFAESTFRNPSSPSFQNPNKTFPTIYDQLQLHGYTKRRAFSLWLNDISAKTGSIVFGGIDTTKYHGELVSLPVQLQQHTSTDWAVAFTSVAQSNSQGTKVLTAKNFSVYAIVDCGSPNNYVPAALGEEIASSMNATMHEGTPYVKCTHRKSSDFLQFGFGGPGGPKISVPYSALIYPFGYPANIGNVTSTRLCYLGVIGTPGPIILLGDAFIRSTYMVFDVDNLKIALAPVIYSVSKEHVVPIPAGTGLPGVKSTNTYLLPTPSPSTS